MGLELDRCIHRDSWDSVAMACCKAAAATCRVRYASLPAAYSRDLASTACTMAAEEVTKSACVAEEGTDNNPTLAFRS
jgi:hypothetical protein